MLNKLTINARIPKLTRLSTGESKRVVRAVLWRLPLSHITKKVGQ